MDEFTSRGYTGNKFKLLSFIQKCLANYGVNEVRVVADLFCGTGIVSHMFANLPGVRSVISNDTEVYATILTEARLSNEPVHAIQRRINRYTKKAEKLKTDPRYSGGTLTSLYARPPRTIFTKEHAMMLDALAYYIHAARPKDVSCIASLLETALRVNNGFGHFHSAPLTARKRTVELRMTPLRPSGSSTTCRVLRGEAHAVFDKLRSTSFDLVYIDPPYSKNGDYGRSFHVLNTLALNDLPDVTGQYNIRKDVYTSPFATKTKAHDAFGKLLSLCVKRCKYICVSYSTTGILTPEEIVAMLDHLECSKVRTYSIALPAYRGGTYTELLILATSPRRMRRMP